MNDSILNQVSPNQTVNKLLDSSSKSLIISTLFQKTFSVHGKNKLIIKNDTPIISNIPSTILKNLKVIHPLQILMKDKLDSMIYGDSSNLMLVIFHYLLKGSQKLLVKGMKPSLITKYLDEIKEEILLILEGSVLEVSNPKNMIQGVLKNDKLTELVLEGYLSLRETKGVDIQIYKMNGTLNDSYIEKGLVLQKAIGTIKSLPLLKEPGTSYKTLLLSCPLDISRTETKGTVLFEDADQLLAFDSSEEVFIEDIIKNLNADLIICETISAKFLDLCNIYKKMVIIVTSKFELIRLQKLLGGIISPQLRKFSDSEFGKMSSVRLSENMSIVESDAVKLITIILKDNIECFADEKERLINKSLKVLFKSSHLRMVKGAGIIELKISEKIKTKYENSKSEVAFLIKESFLEIHNMINKQKSEVEIFDDFESKYHAIRCAFELIEDILLCEDYYISKG
ncbi:T-complex protein 1 subunit theta [Cucumispora dikerogammari]|nr:T-complex protein 1 subunit theta [Cucumispora dikerogammari]